MKVAYNKKKQMDSVKQKMSERGAASKSKSPTAPIAPFKFDTSVSNPQPVLSFVTPTNQPVSPQAITQIIPAPIKPQNQLPSQLSEHQVTFMPTNQASLFQP